MARGRKRSGGEYAEFWPGYVDVLSTLLLTMTFLLSIFMLSQFFVSQESSGKDTVLRRLTRQISELTSLLSLEKGKGKSLEDEIASLQASLATLKAENGQLSSAAGLGDKSAGEAAERLSALSKALADEKGASADALAKVDLLNQQLLNLRRQIAALNETLQAAEAKDKDAQSRITDLGARLLVLHAAWKVDTVGTHGAREDISCIKFFVARVMLEVVDRAIQVHGALGLTNATPLSMFYRQERAARIYDGPDEVHKSLVARKILERHGMRVKKEGKE